MPNSPTLTHSGGSSGTVVAEAPAFSLPAGSPQSMRPPASASGDPAASQMPSHSLQQAVCGNPGSAMPQVQPTAAAQRMQRRRINGTAAFQQALNVSAPARTLLAVICAAFFYSGGSEAVASAWERHIGQPLPGAALLQHVPPIAAMLPLQLLGMLLTFLLRSPVHQQPEAASVLGGLWAATGSVSPHLHSALGVMWPFYQHLWQVLKQLTQFLPPVSLLPAVSGAVRWVTGMQLDAISSCCRMLLCTSSRSHCSQKSGRRGTTATGAICTALCIITQHEYRHVGGWRPGAGPSELVTPAWPQFSSPTDWAEHEDFASRC